MMLAAITFLREGAWPWVLVAAVVLFPLAWWALQPLAPRRGERAVAVALRCLALALLLLCLLEPNWTAPRPLQGSNVLAVLVDRSQSLQLRPSGSHPAAADTLRRWLNHEPGWSKAIADVYQLRRYTFDREVRRVADFADLAFDGERSDLGAALRAVRERTAGQPLAGIVLFTDGNATDLPAGLPSDVDALPPVYPVRLGRGAEWRDVRLDRVEMRRTAFDDTPVQLRVTLAHEGAGSGAATVQVQPLGGSTTGDAPPARVVPANHAAPLEFSWRPSGSGVQFYEVSVAPPQPELEATLQNNRRLVMADQGRTTYRVLYVGGRMNWEFKYLNRALAEDPQLQLVALMRLAHREPKFEFKGRQGEASNPFFRGFGGTDDTIRYDQPVLTRLNTRDASELRGGFPRLAEELFAYDAVILDDVEAAFFSPDQLQLLRQFVSDRGGGLMMLGGADSLESGGYQDTPLAAALPVYLDRLAASTPRGQLAWSLTREGWVQPFARVRAEESQEKERLDGMPRFLVGHALGAIKPGATILAQLQDETGENYPALVAQPFGRGRVAALAVGDLWRWGLRSAAEQADLARFWRQLTRWLVTDVPAPVEIRATAGTSGPGVELNVFARTKAFRPADSAQVSLTVRRIAGTGEEDPEGTFQQATFPAEPVADQPGQYSARLDPRAPGAYLATATVQDSQGNLLGQAETGWVNDPAADEYVRLQPNDTLLDELARRSGGRTVEPEELDSLVDTLNRTPAPVMELASRPLWHNSLIFLLVLGCLAAEWGWKRWRGLA